MKKKEEILFEKFKGIAEELKKCKPLSTDYWIKENEVIEQLKKEQEKEKNMLKMSHERMQQRFDI